MFGDDQLVLGRFEGRLYLAPRGFFHLDKIELALVSNGCGPGTVMGKVVPDKAWGLSLAGPCHIHDYMYQLCMSIWDELVSDAVFAFNLVLDILMSEGNKLVKTARMLRVSKYIMAVGLTMYSEQYWEENKGSARYSRFIEASMHRVEVCK